LPDGKMLIERESRHSDFNASRFWRAVMTAHLRNRVGFAAKVCFESTAIAPKLAGFLARARDSRVRSRAARRDRRRQRL
jgi:hypothetical protein